MEVTIICRRCGVNLTYEKCAAGKYRKMCRDCYYIHKREISRRYKERQKGCTDKENSYIRKKIIMPGLYTVVDYPGLEWDMRYPVYLHHELSLRRLDSQYLEYVPYDGVEVDRGRIYQVLNGTLLPMEITK